MSFARSSAAAQQRLIDTVPEGEARAAAEAIRERQADAFDKDAFATGTALYPDVGPARPIDDIEGRIAQARMIAAYRGILVVPFTANEIATMRRQYGEGTPQQREAVLTLVNAVPEDMRPALDEPPSSGPHTYGIDALASMNALHDASGHGTDDNASPGGRGAVHATEPPPGSPEFQEAGRQVQELDKPSNAADTSDLASLYKALEPDPNSEYGTLLPVAKDANGVRPAMPASVRSFLKGVLDLLAGTKTGALTPEALDTFTMLNGGVGRTFGPHGGADTLAAGGKRKLVAPLPTAKGHHWVPKAIWDVPNLSPEARMAFNNDTSGWYGELHLWSKEHAAYNDAIGELWEKKKYNPSKMTKRDAENFAELIMNSRDPRIAAFRQMILRKAREYDELYGAELRGGDKK